MIATVPTFTSAHSHQAPSGWAYPINCCSNQDCREVSATLIKAGWAGYVIGDTGEVIGYADHRLKDSPDGLYHWCTIGGTQSGATICLFVPPQSF
jgi:hypothetical protein